VTTLGTSRSLLGKYIEMKKTKNLLGNKSSDSSGILLTDSKVSLLGERRNSPALELSKLGKVNNEFMEIFEKTNRLFKEINNEFVKLQNEQHRRILPKFEEDENRKISKSIDFFVQSITKKIFECEENIKKISNMSGLSISENSMKENIKINLAGKLQEISRKIRNNEEDYMTNFRELGQEDVTREPSPENKYSKGDFLEVSYNDIVLHQRDQEISHLVKSIGELSVVFKEMSILVNEQGTILDRIDYNIESALMNTKQANKHLIKTEKLVESGCARNSIMILIIIIFVEAILLLIKFR